VTDRRVFIAPVAEPCNGAWHDLSDFDSLDALLETALTRINRTPANNFAEELDCPDYDGFGSHFRGSYYVSPHEAWALHEFLLKCEERHVPAEAALAYMANFHGDKNLDEIIESYRGIYPKLTDYAEEYLDATGVWQEIPEHLAQYFDVKSYAEDMVGDSIWTAEVEHGLAIFANM
jgi:antirestriction protein